MSDGWSNISPWSNAQTGTSWSDGGSNVNKAVWGNASTPTPTPTVSSGSSGSSSALEAMKAAELKAYQEKSVQIITTPTPTPTIAEQLLSAPAGSSPLLHAQRPVSEQLIKPTTFFGSATPTWSDMAKISSPTIQGTLKEMPTVGTVLGAGATYQTPTDVYRYDTQKGLVSDQSIKAQAIMQSAGISSPTFFDTAKPITKPFDFNAPAPDGGYAWKDILARSTKEQETREAERYWESLPIYAKADLLLIAGFNKPVEIGGSFIESKLFGGQPKYKEEIYNYLIKDTDKMSIPYTNIDVIIPKTNVLTDTAVGIGTTIVTGGLFKVASPLAGGILGLGEKTAGTVATKTLLASEKSTGIIGKTALQTTGTVADLTAGMVGWGARHPEAVLGGAMLVPFGMDIAASETKGEAIAKVGYVGFTLPLMGVGYRGTEVIGKEMPTPREFFRFVAGKAEPLKGTDTFKFIEEKIPESVKTRLSSVKTELTRDPTAVELMPETTKQIYKKLPTKEAKIMLETTFIALEQAKKFRPAQERELYKPFDYTTFKEVTKETGLKTEAIMRTDPTAIQVGSTSAGAFVPKFGESRGGTLPVDIYELGKPAFAKIIKPGVGDIELASKHPELYKSVLGKEKSGEKIGQKTGVSIHGVERGSHAFGVIGADIRTSFGGKSVKLHTGKVLKPISVEGGIPQLSLVQQSFLKTEGMVKFLSRETNMLKKGSKEWKAEYSPQTSGKEDLGQSLRRGKDIFDIPLQLNVIGKKMLESPRTKKSGEIILREMKTHKKAEVTKLYSGLPIEEYGYSVAKGYTEVAKPIPIFLGNRTVKTEYTYPEIKPTKKLDIYGGYPEAKPVKRIVSTPYPSSKAQKDSGYPPTSTSKDFYPPPRIEIPKEKIPTTDYPYPYPPTREPPKIFVPKPPKTPTTTHKTDFGIPFKFPELKFREEGHPKPSKQERQYVYRPRDSPIFDFAEKLWKDSPNPITGKTKSVKINKIIKAKKQKKSFWEA